MFEFRMYIGCFKSLIVFDYCMRLPDWYTYMGRCYLSLGSSQYTSHYRRQHPDIHCMTHMMSSNNFWRDLLDYARHECADTADLNDGTWVGIGVEVSGFHIQSSFVSVLTENGVYAYVLYIYIYICSPAKFRTAWWIFVQIPCHKGPPVPPPAPIFLIFRHHGMWVSEVGAPLAPLGFLNSLSQL